MDIKNVGNNINPIKTAYNKSANQTPKNAESKPSDKLEISNAARDLQTKNVSSKDLEAIRQKIDSNFYNSEEVMVKVAEAILKDMA